MGNLVPDTELSAEQNAARMALFAEAAYLDDQQEQAAARRRFAERYPQGKVAWWQHENAAGLIYVDDQRVCMGIASRPADELRSDVGLLRQTVCEWSDRTGIPVPTDARTVGSTRGFLEHATHCYMGIERAFHEHFTLTLTELSKPMWIAGHCLGGAVAQILQCTTLFTHARTFVYGSPKVFVQETSVPERLRVSVRHFADPVIYLPRGYHHPSAETFYVRSPGAVGKTIPWSDKPIALAYSLGAWARRWTQPSNGCLAIGHSMQRYQRDLWPLR